MLKMFVFWLLLQPLYPTAPMPAVGAFEGCGCPAATSLQKTGETATSYSFTWTGNTEATSYEVWYVRDGGFTSSVVTTTATAHTFNNLLPGQHTFYVRVVCDCGTSGFIGIEDIIES